MRSRPTVGAPLPTTLAPRLLRWYRRSQRPLPWRFDRNPYRVWVAEVLLQQTRVATASAYFPRFLREFPTVEALARAPIGRVLKVWEGAGYYARAHHLHEAARVVVRTMGGTIPSTVPELERLPGVGPYIARAVASIAFGTPTVALEANGLRVAARWTRDEGDVRDARVRAALEEHLRSVLPPRSPGEFNEAMMELGETLCLPAHPKCPRCPVAFGCRARLELRDPGTIPARRKQRRRPHVRAAIVVLREGGRWFVQRRPPAGLLPGLWEFPGGRVEQGESAEAAARRELREETGFVVGRLRPVGTVHHAYSHFTVELHAFAGARRSTGSRPKPLGSDGRWVTSSELERLPLPKATKKVVALVRRKVGRASPGSGSRRGRRLSSRP